MPWSISSCLESIGSNVLSGMGPCVPVGQGWMGSCLVTHTCQLPGKQILSWNSEPILHLAWNPVKLLAASALAACPPHPLSITFDIGIDIPLFTLWLVLINSIRTNMEGRVSSSSRGKKKKVSLDGPQLL